MRDFADFMRSRTLTMWDHATEINPIVLASERQDVKAKIEANPEHKILSAVYSVSPSDYPDLTVHLDRIAKSFDMRQVYDDQDRRLFLLFRDPKEHKRFVTEFKKSGGMVKKRE